MGRLLRMFHYFMQLFHLSRLYTMSQKKRKSSCSVHKPRRVSFSLPAVRGVLLQNWQLTQCHLHRLPYLRLTTSFPLTVNSKRLRIYPELF